MTFSLALLTWTQTLVRHQHLHALLAGGVLAADGAWISGKPGFLFPAQALSSVFRGKFMAAIIAGHAAGQLQPESMVIEAIVAFMQRVAQVDITCCTSCKTGHFHVTAEIAPNRSHATQTSPHQTGPPP